VEVESRKSKFSPSANLLSTAAPKLGMCVCVWMGRRFVGTMVLGWALLNACTLVRSRLGSNSELISVQILTKEALLFN
jgi:hypothetical protein